MRIACIVGFVITALGCQALAEENQITDHPLIGRFEDSNIIGGNVSAFDEFILLTKKYTGKAEWGEAGKERFGRKLEGKVTRIRYESPKNRSTLEVFRAYEEALKENGFDILFKCDDAACGGSAFNKAVIPYSLVMSHNEEDQRYLAVKKARPSEGDVYAAIYTVRALSIGGPQKNRIYTQVYVIEEKPRETGVVVVKAEDMARKIDTEGKVALYGIYFDTDSAKVKTDSKPALDEIAKLLRSNQEMKLVVVGHTDNQGEFDYNIDLSKRRARAVVDVLVEDYEIARSRLTPWGVGFTAPRASNARPEGRAKNRRVELVAR